MQEREQEYILTQFRMSASTGSMVVMPSYLWRQIQLTLLADWIFLSLALVFFAVLVLRPRWIGLAHIPRQRDGDAEDKPVSSTPGPEQT